VKSVVHSIQIQTQPITMKTPSHRHPAAFTLIELMATITIIVILAGIVVGGMGYVGEKQAVEKAKVQIALLSKAIEEYKLDMGFYPPTGNVTSASGKGGTSTSRILFSHLYFDSDQDGSGVPGDTDQKIYLPELDPQNNKQGWTIGTADANTFITDPWGNQYCYRSALNASGNPNSAARNPDFDLWSMGKDGKTRAGVNDSLNHADNRDDIRNF
jgi:general secretion pathway protein G